MCIESKCVFNVETNVPTLTLSTSLTSLFKLQTRRTCQQWPQGNDKTVLCCLLAGGKKKNKKKQKESCYISACQLGNASVALRKTLCVSARTSDFASCAEQPRGDTRPQPSPRKSPPRYAPHTVHMLLLLLRSGTLTV